MSVEKDAAHCSMGKKAHEEIVPQNKLENFMTLLSAKKSLSVIALASTLMFTTANVMAMDVITAVPNLISGSQTFFYYTKSVSDTISRTGYITEALFNMILFPFAILDENTNTIAINGNDLKDLNYTSEEISEYQNDLNKISDLLSTSKFSSKAEAQKEISGLNLGVVAKEQLRLE